MDVAQLIETAASMGTYGPFIPLIGACAAGLCTVALLAGTSRIHRKDLPEDFPLDGEAASPKYVLPFNQLYGSPDDDVEDMTKINTGQALPASTLCASAFEMFKRANIRVTQERKMKKAAKVPKSKKPDNKV